VLFAEIVSRREGYDCVILISELGERRIFCSLVLLFLPITRIVVSTRYAFSPSVTVLTVIISSTIISISPIIALSL
jgi:hypothetical protein